MARETGAVRFNGTSAYLTIADDAAWDAFNDDGGILISVWFKRDWNDSSTGSSTLISSAGSFKIHFDTFDRAVLTIDTRVMAGPPCPKEQRTHLLVCYDDGGISWYINGGLWGHTDFATGVAVPKPTATIYVGSTATNANFFKGTLARLSFSSFYQSTGENIATVVSTLYAGGLGALAATQSIVTGIGTSLFAATLFDVSTGLSQLESAPAVNAANSSGVAVGGVAPEYQGETLWKLAAVGETIPMKVKIKHIRWTGATATNVATIADKNGKTVWTCIASATQPVESEVDLWVDTPNVTVLGSGVLYITHC